MKRKVVFFDRDGVVNNNGHYYTYKWQNFSFNPGVKETMLMLQNKGYEFIVISNQSGIAKGLYTIIDVEKLHEQVNYYLQKENIRILEYYYCTHHPEFSNCLCRKPSSLLFEKAIARFDIDISQSWMIGDQPRDIEAAEKVGIKGILIEPNTDLRQIIKIILKR